MTKDELKTIVDVLLEHLTPMVMQRAEYDTREMVLRVLNAEDGDLQRRVR